MSPVLPREERDAIRALHSDTYPDPGHSTAVCCAMCDEWPPCKTIRLLDALDAAEAEVAALRGRIEALHRPDDHGPGRCDKAECFTSCVECGDDWPCATIRALAADEGDVRARERASFAALLDAEEVAE